MTGARRVTREDVARIAGVSTAVVSYVLNNGPRAVSESTRQRVLAAVEKTGYRVDDVARALAAGRSRVFGFAAPSLINPFISEIASELARAAADRGVLLLLADTREDAGREVKMLRSLIQRQVDGIIYMSTTERLSPDLATGCDIPTVIFELAEDNPHVASVRIDEVGASEALTEHLVEHGYPSFAGVVGPDTMMNSSLRLAGFERALDRARIPASLRWSSYAGTTREAGFRAGRSLFDRDQPVRAVFTGNEDLAIGVISAATEAGLRVPEDVAVAAFNGSTESRFHVPPLTISRQPIREMADRTVAVLSATRYTPADHYFPTELVIRRSCGCSSLPT